MEKQVKNFKIKFDCETEDEFCNIYDLSVFTSEKMCEDYISKSEIRFSGYELLAKNEFGDDNFTEKSLIVGTKLHLLTEKDLTQLRKAILQKINSVLQEMHENPRFFTTVNARVSVLTVLYAITSPEALMHGKNCNRVFWLEDLSKDDKYKYV